MLPSIEIRWFTEGPLPAEVIDWYEEAVGLAHWEERVDRYVNPVSPGGLNVKWREGHIEIKRLVDVLGPVRWGDVAGVAERWRRWSFPLADDLPLAATGKDWIQVAKHRSVRTLTIKEGALVLTRPGEQLPHGCRVEIVGIESRHRQWWSVAMAGFGPDAEARDMIQRTGDRIFAEAGTPRLTEEASMSYVRWLYMRERGLRE